MALEDLLKKYKCKDEEELEKVMADAEEATKRLKEFEKQAKEDAMKDINTFIEQAKKDGKLLPKHEEGIRKNFESLLEKNDEEGIKGLKAFITEGPKRVDLDEKARKDDEPKTYDETKPAGKEVDRLAREYMADGKAKDYEAALQVVRTNHEELWKKYNASK